jgi:hypothetical protein
MSHEPALMSTPSLPYTVDKTGRARKFGPREVRLLLFFGVLLFGLLATFRTNVMSSDFNNFEGWGVAKVWLRFIPDLGLVVLIEVLWWGLGATLLRAWPRVWSTLFVVAHVFLSAVEICSEQYFRMSGQRLRPSYAFFVLVHPPGGTGSIVSSNLDLVFWARVGGFVAAMVLGVVVLMYLGAPKWRAPRWTPAVFLLFGVLLFLFPREEENRASKISESLLSSFLVAMRPDFSARPVLLSGIVRYSAPQVTGQAPPGAPNIIMVVLESSRADLIRPLTKGASPAMPYLAHLASQGLDFQHVAIGMNHTSKALVTIHCGMWPRLGMDIQSNIPGKQPLACLPGLLQDGGYHTAYWQSAFGVIENRPGLVKNFGYAESTAAEALENPRFQEVGYIGIDEFAMLDPATQWMEKQTKPFFVGMLTSSTHHPYQAPGSSPAETVAQRWPHYLAAARHVDRFIEALVTRLEQSHLLENTILVFVGDHGESFGDWNHPGFGGHDACPYDECVRVPLVMYGPKWLGPARQINGLRHQVDLLPTLMNLAGVPWRGDVPGRDLIHTQGHDTVYTACYWTNTCLVRQAGDISTVYHYLDRAPEVFNLKTDPLQAKDIAPTLPDEVIEDAVQDLQSFQESVSYYYRGAMSAEASDKPAPDGH